ncbi:hypothetical protein GJAV_G00243050 [Gymnothorax javanicus]|nr:hypothetical protein GJAV_G00243050 [Gymnothorax javanicus]
MFSKKSRRNFRTRRDESSEEDEATIDDGEEKRVNTAPVVRRSRLPQSRGISCTSKPDVATIKTKSNSADDVSDENKCDTDEELSQPAGINLNTDAQRSSDEKKDNFKCYSIPDAKQISATVKRRREARAQRDYIPLDCEQERAALSEGESEGESDDGSDDEHRIQFAPRTKTLRERVAEEMGRRDSEDDETNSEEEKEQTLWEEQQIRKGVSKHKHPAGSSSPETVRQRRKCDIPESLPQISIDAIKKRVSAKLEAVRQVHRGRAMDLQRLQMEMDSAKATVDKLENGSAREQHQFYRDMRIYTENLLQCLGEKQVEINAVELDMHTLLIDQAEALLQRRREAVREKSSHLQQLAYNTDSSSGGHADGAQTLEQGQSPSCGAAEMDSVGLPADAEASPEEAAELSRRRDEILKKAEDIFADVHEDFSDVKNILSKFDGWRSSLQETYENAYISLCLPKLLAPFVRHQLIGWNPLQTDCMEIEAFPWYAAVEQFSHKEKTEKLILRSIIEKTIVPKIQGFVELVWDPLSSGQSNCLVCLCRGLLSGYLSPPAEQSKPVTALLDAVTARLRSAVDEDVFIPLYPEKFLDDASSPHFQFRDEQFYSAVKLLRNIVLWSELLPDDVLIELGLKKLLSRYLMLTLRGAPGEKHSVEKCKKIAASFPKSWFEDVNNSPFIPELQIFSKHLLQTVDTLCRRNPYPTIVRDILSDLLNLLRSMEAWDSVTEIVQKYQVEDLDATSCYTKRPSPDNLDKCKSTPCSGVSTCR